MRQRRRTTALAILSTVATAFMLLVPATLGATAANAYPTCASSASDPDGDGWGWENNQSCIVAASTSTTYPTCASSASDPDGDGWGWENNQSCKVATTSTGGSTSACPNGMACGSYSVSGLGSRKQQVLGAGADTLDLAVAMLETETMSTNYAYGDNKTYDAANFGIYKMNWLMIRTACSQFQGQSSSSYNNGAALNSNLSADVTCMNQSQSYYGLDKWFAGHRNGSSGLSNPYTTDIANYKAAIYWIQAQINSSSSNKSNDTRFWVSVPAI